MSKTLRRTAVHEAGHFVFARAFNLGLSTNLFICDERAGPRGQHSRKTTSDMELILRAEIKKNERLLDEAQQNADFWAEYIHCRPLFAWVLMVEALAGSAAEYILAGGDGLIGHSDYHAACDYSEYVESEETRAQKMERAMTEARNLCYTTWRAPILAVAERLLTRRCFDQNGCAALWEEVRPEITAETVVMP